MILCDIVGGRFSLWDRSTAAQPVTLGVTLTISQRIRKQVKVLLSLNIVIALFRLHWYHNCFVHPHHRL